MISKKHREAMERAYEMAMNGLRNEVAREGREIERLKEETLKATTEKGERVFTHIPNIEHLVGESISVLGTDYNIKYSNDGEDKGLTDRAGYCDFSIKTCVIDDFKDDGTGKCYANLSTQQNKTVRHELIHAFLYESGLDLNSIGKWAANEEMVDWLAINSPKIFKAFEELGIL